MMVTAGGLKHRILLSSLLDIMLCRDHAASVVIGNFGGVAGGRFGECDMVPSSRLL